MARITVEDCLTQVENTYELVHLATKRVRQLYQGAHPKVECKNREIVTSLREIALGFVSARYNYPSSPLDETPPLSN